MKKHVIFPKNFVSDELIKLTSKFIDETLTPVADEFDLDFSQIKYISPSAVGLLDNLIGWLENQGVTINVEAVTFNKEKMCPISFLRDAGFFEKYLENAEEEYRIVESKYILPINTLKSSNYEEWSNKFSLWISSILEVEVSEVASITAAVKDILNNVSDHANIDTCGIFGQYILSKKQFYISISDFGVGIPYNVKHYLNNNFDDLESLKWAMVEGNSTRSTPKNRGAGLHFLLSNIVQNNCGTLRIFSNRAKIICKSSESGIQLEGIENKISHPGTLILIKLDKHQLMNNLDEKEEFTWDEL
ncbi:hypothetical protein GP484_01525 [Mammaliicoccus sciuri]|uniref:hypothetical protein n=1 Tax=Mammaliicoccus sciuri TaxID=1296 RepID=UPI001E450A57|nr:hypothetical protein [Mammaliicoccus sciuri]MCD3218530.1 hypothetical protein [Mammaliicoccus sciuri]MCJ0921354.1 hypothetical protein [Mammaliicoccus sciuri]MEB7732936.1 hypothetical protein [Mammaliicoccus sciuri]